MKKILALFLAAALVTSAFIDYSQVKINSGASIEDFKPITQTEEVTFYSNGQSLKEYSGIDSSQAFAFNKEDFLSNGVFSPSDPIPQGFSFKIPDSAITVSKGTQSVVGGPSLTPTQITNILKAYGSPASGSGQCFYDLSKKYNIDAAFMLAFFRQESGMGRATGYSTHHSIGNIVKTGSGRQYCDSTKRVGSRFCGYASWCDAAEHWFYYIKNSGNYLPKGRDTPEEIIPIYAPASDNNNPAGYIAQVNKCVKSWRSGSLKC
ncbi:glucosaminidase domain-containing protein [Candidatus Micrarchaeota archaeon]|nr:glucosaminidase domain-containing protein [Candidatus Micrarchaeota archaeon]